MTDPATDANWMRCQTPRWSARALLFIGTLLVIPITSAAQSRTTSKIDWAAVAKAQQQPAVMSAASAVRGSVPAASELDKIGLPVLLLPPAADRSTPRVRHQSSSYAAAYSLEDAKLSIVGSNSMISIPNKSMGTKAANVATPSTIFDRTEDGADLSFNRYGASYTLRISCAKPSDPRCTAEAFLKGIADQVVPVGGRKQ